MKVVMINPFNTVKNTVTGIVHEGGVQIGSTYPTNEYRPTQIHYLPLGTLEDKPSLLIVGYDLENMVQYAQMSMEMVKKAFKEMGLEIVNEKEIAKITKWNDLEKAISEEYGFTNKDGEWEEWTYPDSQDGNDHDLTTIGEKAASAFGYLQ